MEVVVIVVIAVVALAAWGVHRGARDDGAEPDSRRSDGKAAGLANLGFDSEVVRHTSTEHEQARQLFKDATAASAEDPDKAIALFRKACDQAALTSVDHGIDVYLRLPRYLQEAGKSEEGWREFNNLLVKGYPNMLEGNRTRHYMESAVYDKMRLFLQREKRTAEAVVFGAKSIIFEIKALLTEWPSGPAESSQGKQHLEQWHRKNLRMDMRSAESLRHRDRLSRELTKLLRRAKLLDRHDEALAVLCEWADAQPNADDAGYAHRFDQAHREMQG